MIDSDNVLLLRPPSAAAHLVLADLMANHGRGSRPGFIVSSIGRLSASAEVAVAAFEVAVKPWLLANGVADLTWMIPEPTPNNFPRLPVRENESVLIWLARFGWQQDETCVKRCLDHAAEMLRPYFDGEPEVLRLGPTTRSKIQ